MRYDFSPFYRSMVGFDHLFELLDEAGRTEPGSWPPYNTEKSGDERYRITMAVAGFSPDEIELVQRENELLITGKKAPEPAEVQMLHRGIATRAFKQSFKLADHVKVTSAALENSLLRIELLRKVPDALKPRRIVIGGSDTRRIEQAKAA
ncbi:MAG: Hsp20 family protein [Variibacter sp.]